VVAANRWLHAWKYPLELWSQRYSMAEFQVSTTGCPRDWALRAFGMFSFCYSQQLSVASKRCTVEVWGAHTSFLPNEIQGGTA